MTKSGQKSHERPQRRGRSLWNLALPFPLPEARRSLLAWYDGNNRQLPWRMRWAASKDPYTVWVSEIMLQQTVIKAVIPVYERFMARFPSVKHLAQAADEDVRSAVRGLGYYRRFGMLHAASKVILERRGEWPRTFDGWKELPGIGDYTAAAVSSIAFGEACAVVDGNVERVLCRLLDLQVSPAEPGLKNAFRLVANDFLDPRRPGDFNQAIMELGQLCCTVSSPSCQSCPLVRHCLAFARKTQSLAPKPKLRKTATKVALRLAVILQKGQVALVERPIQAKFLRQSWGFLTGLAQESGDYAWDGANSTSVNQALLAARPFAKKVKHTITHHQIEAQIVTLDAKVLTKIKNVRWIPVGKLDEALVSNLDRKAWHVYLRESSHL